MLWEFVRPDPRAGMRFETALGSSCRVLLENHHIHPQHGQLPRSLAADVSISNDACGLANQRVAHK